MIKPAPRQPAFSALAVALAFWLALADAPGTAAQGDAPAPAPVVVELFTSQGCSSCPPADALLGELAGRPDVIALSLHVDYWDHIGWPDPFASPRHTARQRAYAQNFRLRYVYTPQMVIDGQHDVVGSRRIPLERALSEAAVAPKPASVTVRRNGPGGATLKLAPRPDLAGADALDGATVWMVAFDGAHETDVASGENAGRRLTHHNVVRQWEKLADWDGEPMELALDLGDLARAGRDGCAILVQRGDSGPILGAAMITLTGAEG